MKSCFALLALASALLSAHADDSYVLTYSGPNIGNSEKTARKVFEGVSLMDYQVRVAAMGDYEKYRGNNTYVNGAGRFLYLPIRQTRSVKNGNDRLTAQVSAFEYYTPTYSTYQMEVVLEQRGADIYGWIENAYVVDASVFWAFWADVRLYREDASRHVRRSSGGYDHEDLGGGYGKGYSVDFLRLERVDEADTVITPTEGQDLVVNGKQVIRDPGELDLSGNISGIGDLTYEATTLRTGCADTVYYGDATTYLKTSWCTVAKNRLLSAVTNVVGAVGGSNIGSGNSAVKCYFFQNNGTFATCQMQRSVNYNPLRCAIVNLRQSGADIQAVVDLAMQGPDGTTYKPGTDFLNPPEGMTITTNQNISTSDKTPVFGIKGFGLQFRADSTPHIVTSSGINGMHSGAVIRVVGTATVPMLVNFTTQIDSKGLPANGSLEVGTGGHAVLSKEVSAKYYRAYDGGVIYQGSNNCFKIGMISNLILDNGKFVAGYQGMNSSKLANGNDAYLYLNYVEMLNGASLVGCKPRVGYGMFPCWRVGGSNGNPSFCSTGMSLFPKQNAAATAVTLDVDDVTGDARPDFVMTSPVILQYPNDTTYHSQYFLKRGAGTFSMEASFAAVLPTVISNGTWRIGATAAGNGKAFFLDGGSLEIAPGLSVDMGAVTPSVASDVVIGEGATLSIPAPTAAWPQGVKLNFVGADIETRGAIKVGDSACLDAASLRRFKINGHSVAQKEDGGLVRSDPGLVLFVR